MKVFQKMLVVALVVVVFGGIFYFAAKPVAQTPRVDTFTTEKNQTDYMTMDLSYPESAAINYPELFAYVQKSKQDFLDDFNSLTPTDIQTMHLGGDRKYNFTLTTNVATSTKTVTYIVEVYTFTGGAHGGTSVATFTYDAGGKLVTLQDVFMAPYLQKVSDLAHNYFYATIDPGYLQPDSVNAGTAPTAENYSAWYLTDKNIVFIFGQYQVGPYVLGIQEFPLSKQSIADILSPKFK